MYKHNDLSGMRFGKLTVMKENGSSKDRHITWDCICDCGNKVIAMGRDLVNGHTQSCGCQRKETLSNVRTKHGDRDGRCVQFGTYDTDPSVYLTDFCSYGERRNNEPEKPV